MNNIQFGDVWICSGQSNMEWPMYAIMNSTEEISKMAEYPNIKLFKLAHMTAPEPQSDLTTLDFEKWASTSESDKIQGFSAICLLTIRNLADRLGKDKV